MELTLVKLKSDFNNIIAIRNNVKNIFDILQVRIDKLRQIYSEFIKNNKNEMFIFGLDSFRFQSKLIDIEYDDMVRLFLAINNRMYCEYFKLHKLIVEYILKITNDKKVSEVVKMNSYPPYKDLEPFKEYKFELVLDIHENTLNLLSIIISILNNKENELVIHKTKQNIGLNIDNFITGFNFNINVMREKIVMFITYIEFFHKMHSKYLKRFSNKIQLMYTNINNDIKFDENIEMNKDKKKNQNTSSNNNIESLNVVNPSLYLDNNKLSSESPISRISSKSLSNCSSDIANTYISKLSLSQINNFKNTDKKDLKNILKKNVNKVSNMLQIFKPKTDNIDNGDKLIESPFFDSEVEQIFSDINKSCDSIINEENLQLNIGSQDKGDYDIDDVNFLNQSSLSSDILRTNDEKNENPSISIDESSLNIQSNEEVNKIADIEIQKNDEERKEILKSNSEMEELNSLESNNITDISNKEGSVKEIETFQEYVIDNNNFIVEVKEVSPKKKRTYNRKKKPIE